MAMLIIGGHPEDWGFIPGFLNADDPRSAREQIDAHYIGGWSDFKGFTLDTETLQLTYPGDPPMDPISKMMFRDELLIMYDHAWVVILQMDGTWTIARLD